MKRTIAIAAIFAATVAIAEPRTFNNTFQRYHDIRARVDMTGGRYDNFTVVHKFGRSDSIGTTLVPITLSEVYRTPTNATALEVVSSSANDTAAGSGAREILIEGIGPDWLEQTELITMNGTTAVDSTQTWLRVYRAYVSQSGTYATQSAASHAGNITIQEDGGGDEWAVIAVEDSFGKGQTEIGAYTVPSNKVGYLESIAIEVEGSKSVSFLMFQRPNADDVTPPFSGTMRAFQELSAVDAPIGETFETPIGPFVGPCDIGFMGNTASGTAKASVDFEIVLEDK